MKEINVCILGTGNMGTALARLISQNGFPVTMWGIDKEAVENINSLHENRKFLPGVVLRDRVSATLELSKAASSAQVVILAVPAQVAGKVFTEALPHLNKKQIILSASKGIDTGSGLTVSRLIRNKMSQSWRNNLAVLMGPLFASEISTDVPTVGVVAAHGINVFNVLKKILSNSNFFVRYSTDITGAELGGALKNVYAIILGVCDGLGYGWNTKSAAMTAAIREMAAAGQFLGGKKETFYGLAGLGDLLTTGFGEKSRNRRFGEKVCSGKSVNEVLKDIGQVVEGAATVKILTKLLKKSKIKTPLLDAVFALVNDKKDPCQIMHKILEQSSS